MKKHISKIVAIVLIFAMALTLCACKKDENTKNNDSSKTFPSDYQLVWQNVIEGEGNDNNDDWEVEKPYIKDGKLVIEAAVTFKQDVYFLTNTEAIASENNEKDKEKKSEGEEGSMSKVFGYGTVSLDNTFANTAPLTIEFVNETTEVAYMNEEQSCVISFDLAALGTDKPEEIWYRLATKDGDIPLILDLEW